MTNPLRKLARMVGVDVHRYQKTPNPLAWLARAGVGTVIDVGANVGQFASEIRSLLPEAYIFSFEPLRDCYKKLVQSRTNDARFIAFNYALGDSNTEEVIHRSGYSPSSSLLPMTESHKKLFPHTRESRDERITIRRLDDIPELDSTKLEKGILLKIDTQGYENRVLSGGRHFLDAVQTVLIETSFVTLYDGQVLFADIYTLLTARGFSYRGAVHQKRDPENGQVVFEDSIFLKV